MCFGFGISVERILISELKGTTYYARMVCSSVSWDVRLLKSMRVPAIAQ